MVVTKKNDCACRADVEGGGCVFESLLDDLLDPGVGDRRTLCKGIYGAAVGYCLVEGDSWFHSHGSDAIVVRGTWQLIIQGARCCEVLVNKCRGLELLNRYESKAKMMS